MRTIPRWLVASMVLVGCRPAAPAVANHAPLDPPSAVEAVLTRWYDAMQRHDSAGIASPLLPEFFIFEDTTVIAGAALVKELVDGAAAGSQTAALTGFRTVVMDSAAWTSFRNREVWTPTQGRPDTLDFLESVIFRKRNGQWLMERYHATRINRPGR